MSKIVFSAGLPRAGSTLLCSILNQNPRFEAEITNPMSRWMDAMLTANDENFYNKHKCGNEKMDEVFRGLFNLYHGSHKDVYINHNRMWTARLDLLKRLYPDFRMIVCVRDIGWILDSFEVLTAKNPYATPSYLPALQASSIYSRTNSLMNGIVGSPLSYIKQGLKSPYCNQMIFIEYDDLVRWPKETMQSIYDFIGEDWFEHDFGSVEACYDEYDMEIGMPGLHTIRRGVSYQHRNTIIPPDIWDKVHGMEVWRGLQGVNYGFTGHR